MARYPPVNKTRATIQERLDKVLAEKPADKGSFVEESLGSLGREFRAPVAVDEVADLRARVKALTKEVEAVKLVAQQWFWLVTLHGGEARVSLEAAEIIARAKRRRGRKRGVVVMRQTRRKG